MLEGKNVKMFVITLLKRLTLRRKIVAGFSNVQSQRQSSKLTDKLSQPMKFSTVFYLIYTSKYILAMTFVIGIATFYVNKAKKKRRLEGCTHLKSDANFKVSNLRFDFLQFETIVPESVRAPLISC